MEEEKRLAKPPKSGTPNIPTWAMLIQAGGQARHKEVGCKGAITQWIAPSKATTGLRVEYGKEDYPTVGRAHCETCKRWLGRKAQRHLARYTERILGSCAVSPSGYSYGFFGHNQQPQPVSSKSPKPGRPYVPHYIPQPVAGGRRAASKYGAKKGPRPQSPGRVVELFSSRPLLPPPKKNSPPSEPGFFSEANKEAKKTLLDDRREALLEKRRVGQRALLDKKRVDRVVNILLLETMPGVLTVTLIQDSLAFEDLRQKTKPIGMKALELDCMAGREYGGSSYLQGLRDWQSSFHKALRVVGYTSKGERISGIETPKANSWGFPDTGALPPDHLI